jgi:hypothetical protein
LGTRLVERIVRGKHGLTRGGPRRSADQRKEVCDGGNSAIERAERRKVPNTRLQTDLYNRRGSRWRVQIWCGGLVQLPSVHSGSDFELEFNGMLTSNFQISGFSVIQITNVTCDRNQVEQVFSRSAGACPEMFYFVARIFFSQFSPLVSHPLDHSVT